jgi:phosphohistidine phosphatase SixA
VTSIVPLNKRGIEAAPLVGGSSGSARSGLTSCSAPPAKRAAQTVGLVMESAQIECKARYDQRIYAASASTFAGRLVRRRERR